MKKILILCAVVLALGVDELRERIRRRDTGVELAEHLAGFVTDLGVSVIGGCCGTTPEHLAAVIHRCRDLVPGTRSGGHQAGASSIYSFVPFDQDTSFLIIGERANANGSKKFREALLAED